MEPSKQKIIMDLEKVNTLNAEGCPACGRKFVLGEMVVLACGNWDGGPKYIHEEDAVWDLKTGVYYERRCFMERRSRNP